MLKQPQLALTQAIDCLVLNYVNTIKFLHPLAVPTPQPIDWTQQKSTDGCWSTSNFCFLSMTSLTSHGFFCLDLQRILNLPMFVRSYVSLQCSALQSVPYLLLPCRDADSPLYWFLPGPQSPGPGPGRLLPPGERGVQYKYNKENTPYESVQPVGLISLSCNWAILHNEIDQM